MMPLRGASAETRGILYMMMAVATLASMDALAKLLSQHVDTLMVCLLYTSDAADE